MKSSGARRAGIERRLLTILEGPQKLTVSARILVLAVEQHWNLRVDSIEELTLRDQRNIVVGENRRQDFQAKNHPAS